jgi:hypothetical protein
MLVESLILLDAVQFPSSYISRDDEVSELVLVMADVSTNLVMLTGRLVTAVLVHVYRQCCC